MTDLKKHIHVMGEISSVINKSGSEAFTDQLWRFLNRYVKVDHCVVSTYQRGVGVYTIFTVGVVPEKKASDLAKKYEKEYYRDPNFPMLKSPGSGGEQLIPFNINDISDDDYVDFFYTKAGVVDKVSTIASVDKLRVLSSFYRVLPSPVYSQEDLKILSYLLPLTTELIVNHYRLQESIQATGSQNAKVVPITQLIHTLISGEAGPFNKLTQRERDICEHTLLGKTAKEIATDLHIAESTVITHRKRSYLKLDIRTHKELFTLFLGGGGENTV
ncbi:helix-turn-helix transcriptional regulator [Porticoccus sp. GXU_MW_L64]